ncbi:hypothetical protein V2G26_016585 [Clonostachys chloroleuca]
MAAVDIPAKQWAQVINHPGAPIDFREISVPQPEVDEVLVNVKFSGVCHTDLHALLGDWPLQRKMPLVGGHEGTGIVVAKGQQVKDTEIGDHVGIKWLNGTCQSCVFCYQGAEQLCARALLSGYTVHGTFQQYAVAKAAYVTKIPTECSLEDAAPIMCAGLTVYKGLKESGARPGQYVVIVGAGGGLGSYALQYGTAMGINCIGVDTGEDKAQLCKELGAVAFIDYKKSSDIAADLRATIPDGLEAHAVLLLATHEEPFRQAYKYVRPYGIVVCVGMPGQALLQAPVFDTVVRMISIKGSYVGNRLDIAEAMEFFRLGKIKTPHKTLGLSQLQEVYDKMRMDTITGRYMVDTSK